MANLCAGLTLVGAIRVGTVNPGHTDGAVHTCIRGNL
ncbi:predicted protein [Sclerotinia sclerotiorum 1980 UF-70]|uniref:Uncharacterized protein n=1 Tax=Sclerotinia sclerotiorum (strain ATCC 18683 / 1980 / Ss-1) TaxID=665079 RepID=A7F396_SCLS1|nr:predicted protein [Sclerotinia sclerotiorum 1980 UF-70]EDN97217.1 predicted protein [Sclerotinia sclerotiorum 1980 UF-70]